MDMTLTKSDVYFMGKLADTIMAKKGNCKEKSYDDVLVECIDSIIAKCYDHTTMQQLKFFKQLKFEDFINIYNRAKVIL